MRSLTPAGLEDAARILRELSGKCHEVITAVCLMHAASGRLEILTDRTEVQFKRLSPSRIADYLKRVHVLDKAGGYAIQESGEMIIKQIRGSFSNVVGFPVEQAIPILADWGILKKINRGKC